MLLLERLCLSSDQTFVDLCQECGFMGYQGWCPRYVLRFGARAVSYVDQPSTDSRHIAFLSTPGANRRDTCPRCNCPMVSIGAFALQV